MPTSIDCGNSFARSTIGWAESNGSFHLHRGPGYACHMLRSDAGGVSKKPLVQGVNFLDRKIISRGRPTFF